MFIIIGSILLTTGLVMSAYMVVSYLRPTSKDRTNAEIVDSMKERYLDMQDVELPPVRRFVDLDWIFRSSK